MLTSGQLSRFRARLEQQREAIRVEIADVKDPLATPEAIVDAVSDQGDDGNMLFAHEQILDERARLVRNCPNLDSFSGRECPLASMGCCSKRSHRSNARFSASKPEPMALARCRANRFRSSACKHCPPPQHWLGNIRRNKIRSERDKDMAKGFARLSRLPARLDDRMPATAAAAVLVTCVRREYLWP